MTKVSDLISGSKKIILNPDRFQLGRSAYLCKSQECINIAIKEKKIEKMLRVSSSQLSVLIPQLSALIPAYVGTQHSLKEVLVKT